MLEGLSADSEEKREPVSDIDAVVVDSLKALDPERPIREADSPRTSPLDRYDPTGSCGNRTFIDYRRLARKALCVAAHAFLPPVLVTAVREESGH
jgi:hypothetical protein